MVAGGLLAEGRAALLTFPLEATPLIKKHYRYTGVEKERLKTSTIWQPAGEGIM